MKLTRPVSLVLTVFALFACKTNQEPTSHPSRRIAPEASTGSESPEKEQAHGSSKNLAPPWAIEPGAVYELKLRMSWDNVDLYLREYAKWYLPVDQFECPCTYKDQGSCEKTGSGRKLLSVLSRDIGDQYNVVFIYRYESAYKEDYYCKYSKAFFQYHAPRPKDNITGTDGFETLFKAGVDALNAKNKKGTRISVEEVISALPQQCAAYSSESNLVGEAGAATSSADADLALQVADATIHEASRALARMVVSDESTWNVDINVCKVLAWDKAKVSQDPPDIALKKLCTEYRQSLLERAVGTWGLDWGRPNPCPTPTG
jgi:hypothetical protein